MSDQDHPQEEAKGSTPAADDHQHDARSTSDRSREEANDIVQRKPLSIRAKLVLLVLGIAALAAAIFWYVRYEARGKYLQETNDATVQADTVVVAPRISGYVEQVLVADNQDVTAGQPLVRIDPRYSRAQADQATAQIAQAKASGDGARASIREQEAAIGQARVQLDAVQAKAAHDAAEVSRYEPLAATGAETLQQLAQLRATAVQSDADVRSQSSNLSMQQRRIGQYRAQIRQARAQADGARAQLAAANVDLNATLLRAAIDGRIGDKTVTIGQYVQAGTRLMSVVPVSKLYVVANFKETQLALMRPGQPVAIRIDVLDGIALRGRVESIAPGTGAQFSLIAPNNATGNFTKIVQRVPVRISMEATPAARGLLVPGLSVAVTVDTKAAKDDLSRVRQEQDQLGNRAR